MGKRDVVDREDMRMGMEYIREKVLEDKRIKRSDEKLFEKYLENNFNKRWLKKKIRDDSFVFVFPLLTNGCLRVLFSQKDDLTVYVSPQQRSASVRLPSKPLFAHTHTHTHTPTHTRALSHTHAHTHTYAHTHTHTHTHAHTRTHPPHTP